MSEGAAPAAQVENLHVSIGGTEILRGVSFQLFPGKTLGVVGESGCGKTMTGLTLMGMLPGTATMTADTLVLAGNDMRSRSEAEWRQRRGTSVAMVMQDPFTSLHPMMRVGDQIGEVLRLHRGMNKEAALREAVQLLEHVGVPEPTASARKFPH
ncbi:MAG: ABC transporter ATP-binding protein, partial [Fimbriimonadaceae bacterium]|nr:ABC transporter ATP-binding protein [Fimbriimonadaceae bacterium]